MKRVWSVAAVVAALAGLAPALAFDPTQSLYRENRAGITALEKDDPAAALEHFTEAQAQAPDDPRVLYNLGLALARAGKLEQADRAWKRAAQLAQGELSRDAWYNRGVAALSNKNTRGAVDAFAQALMIDPADDEARRNLELALKAAAQQASQQGPSRNSEQQQQQQKQQEQQGSSKGPQAPEDDTSRGDQQQQQQQQQQRQQQRQGEQQERGEQPRDSRPDQQQQAQPSTGDDQQPSPAEARPDAQPGSESASEGGRQGEEDLAARLLKMLEQNEKSALRRALRRQRRGADESREKDW